MLFWRHENPDGTTVEMIHTAAAVSLMIGQFQHVTLNSVSAGTG